MAKVKYSEDGKVLIKAHDVSGHFVVPEGVTKIGDGAFSFCSELTSIEIPDSVTVIGRSAFWYCHSLTNIEIPDSVTVIGDGAFLVCRSLKNPIIVNNMFVRLPETHEGCYSIPSGIKRICGGAFSDCSSLTNIEIPNSVTEIGNDTFSGCSSLTRIKIPDSVKVIGNEAFEGCPIESYEVEEGNPNYTSKEGILLDKAETKIIKFPAWKKMDSYQIPNNIQSLGDCAFACCYRLKTIMIPNGISCIPRLCFAHDMNLHEIHLPATIQTFGKEVFSACFNLTEIHLCVKDPRGINIDEEAFKNFYPSQCTLYVPIGTGYAYRHHPMFSKFKEVIIEK